MVGANAFDRRARNLAERPPVRLGGFRLVRFTVRVRVRVRVRVWVRVRVRVRVRVCLGEDAVQRGLRVGDARRVRHLYMYIYMCVYV